MLVSALAPYNKAGQGEKNPDQGLQFASLELGYHMRTAPISARTQCTQTHPLLWLFCERMNHHVTSARTTEFSVNWEYSCDLSHLCLCLSPLKNGWISGLWALNWPVLDQKLPPFRTFSKNSSNLGWTGVPNTWCVSAPIGLLECNDLFLSNDLRRSAVAKDFGEGCSVPIPNFFLCVRYFLATTPSWQESKDKISHNFVW